MNYKSVNFAVTIIFLGFHCAECQWIDTGIPCDAPSESCQDCSTIKFCGPNSASNLTIQTQKCTNGEVCIGGFCEISNECADSSNINNYEFHCDEEGTYPHPYAAEKYVVCSEKSTEDVPFIGKVINCRAGTLFDPGTLQCTRLRSKHPNLPLLDSNACLNDTTAGPIPGNIRMYYQCKKVTNPRTQIAQIIPIIKQCLAYGIYLGGSTCSSPMVMEGVKNELCTSKGFFYTPSCSAFNECIESGSAPIIRTCPSGYYFDVQTRTCAPYACSWFHKYSENTKI